MPLESHNKGIVHTPNLSPNVSPAHDGIHDTCNHIALNKGGDSGQSAPLKIHYELGSEKVISLPGSEQGNNILTDNLDGTWTLEVIDNVLGVSDLLGLSQLNTYFVNFEILSYTGTITNEYIYINWLDDAQLDFSDGLIFSESCYKSSGLNSYFKFNNLEIGSTITFRVSVKEISIDNSYMIQYDPATKEHIKYPSEDLQDELMTHLKWNQYGTTIIEDDEDYTKFTRSSSYDYSRDNYLSDDNFLSEDLDTYVGRVSLTFTARSTTANGKIYLAQAGNTAVTRIFDQGDTYTEYTLEMDLNGQGMPYMGLYQFADGSPTMHISKTIVVKKILSVSTTHKQTTPFSNASALDIEPTTEDIEKLDADPTRIARLMDNDLTTGLSFVKANVKHWYPCCDYGNGIIIQDMVDITYTPTQIAYHTTYIGEDGTVSGSDYYSSYNPYSPVQEGGGAWLGQVAGLHWWKFEFATPQKAVSYRHDAPHATRSILKFTIEASHDDVEWVEINPPIDATMPTVGEYIPLVEIESPIKAKYFRISFDGEDIEDDTYYNTNNIELMYEVVTPYVEIDGYTNNCRDYFLNTNYGLSKLLIKQGSAGEFESMADANTIDFVNSGGASISTGLRFEGDEYTFIEVVEGELAVMEDTAFYTFDTDLEGFVDYIGGNQNISQENGMLKIESLIDAGTCGARKIGAYDLEPNTDYIITAYIDASGVTDAGFNRACKIALNTLEGIFDETGTNSLSEGFVGNCTCRITTGTSLLDYWIDVRTEAKTGQVLYADNIRIFRVTGSSQRKEYHELKKFLVGDDKYLINNVLQPYVPALPDPSVLMRPDGKSKIGYIEDVDTYQNWCRMFTSAKDTAWSTEKYNEWSAL